MEELGYLNPPAAIKCRAPPWVSIAVARLHHERSVTSWTLRHGGRSHLTAISDRDCSLSICRMSLLMTGVSSPYQIWLWDENECRGTSWWWCGSSAAHEELRVFNVWPSDPFYGSRWATWMPYLEFTIFTYGWTTDGLCALPVTGWTGIHGFGYLSPLIRIAPFSAHKLIEQDTAVLHQAIIV
jgi:hypothetical protein